MDAGLFDDPDAFVAAVRELPAEGPSTPAAALLVDAAGFAVSAQSAQDNAYMDVGQTVDAERARRQLAGVQRALLDCGVPTLVLPGLPDLHDAVFPNNVYAVGDGRLVVGSMAHPVRRAEAERTDVRELFGRVLRHRIVDLSGLGHPAELTGVLAIDRPRRAAVCGLGPRCDRDGAAAMHEALGLAATLLVPLHAGEYHINLVLAVLAGRAAVMFDEGFADDRARHAVSSLWPGAVLHLDEAEKNAFAGNCIAVTPTDVMMSATSWQALCPASRAWFPRHGFEVHAVEVDELEKGGGSLRCLIAEVFG